MRRDIWIFLQRRLDTLVLTLNGREADLSITFSVFVIEPSQLRFQMSIGRKECGNIPCPFLSSFGEPHSKIPEEYPEDPSSLSFLQLLSASLFLISCLLLCCQRLSCWKQAGCLRHCPLFLALMSSGCATNTLSEQEKAGTLPVSSQRIRKHQQKERRTKVPSQGVVVTGKSEAISLLLETFLSWFGPNYTIWQNLCVSLRKKNINKDNSIKTKLE